jgi:hypothetical protein
MASSVVMARSQLVRLISHLTGKKKPKELQNLLIFTYHGMEQNYREFYFDAYIL